MIDQKIARLSNKKASTKPGNLINKYNELFPEKNFDLINELDKSVSAWQSPILSPLFQKRNEIVNNLDKLRTLIVELQETNNGSEQLKELEEKELNKEKEEISRLIDDKIINRGENYLLFLVIRGFLNMKSLILTSNAILR